MSFSAIPTRNNADTVYNSWFDLLRSAGLAIENFLGAGYVGETNVAIANNQSAAANVTGFVFDHTVYTSAFLTCEVRRTTGSSERVSVGTIAMRWLAASSAWDCITQFDGDESGVTFSVTAGGQLQYTSDSQAGTSYVGTIKAKAITFGV